MQESDVDVVFEAFFALMLDKPQDVVYNMSGSPDIPLLSYL